MKYNPELLQLQIQTLKIKKENLIITKDLYTEIYELQEDITNLGGNDLVNFQKDAEYILTTTWDCIAFICGGLLNALDNHLRWLNELPDE